MSILEVRSWRLEVGFW